MKKEFSFKMNGIKVILVCYDEKVFEQQCKLIKKHIVFDNKLINDEIMIYCIKDGIVYEKTKVLKLGQKYETINPFFTKKFDIVDKNNRTIFYSQDDDFVSINNKANKFFILNNPDKYDKYNVLNAILDIVNRRLEENGNFMFHSTACVYNNVGLMILAASGGGKTTLFSKLAQVADKMKFLSNDRVLVTKDLEMLYFPIDINLSMGTVKNDPFLTDYFLKNNITENYLGKRFSDTKVNTRCALHPNILKSVYENIELVSRHNLDVVVLPKINFQDKEIVHTNLLTDKALLKEYLEENCFTPIDKESGRIPWIQPRMLAEAAYQSEAAKFINGEILNKPVIYLEYGANCDLSKLKENFEQMLDDIRQNSHGESNDERE